MLWQFFPSRRATIQKRDLFSHLRSLTLSLSLSLSRLGFFVQSVYFRIRDLHFICQAYLATCACVFCFRGSAEADDLDALFRKKDHRRYVSESPLSFSATASVWIAGNDVAVTIIVASRDGVDDFFKNVRFEWTEMRLIHRFCVHDFLRI